MKTIVELQRQYRLGDHAVIGAIASAFFASIGIAIYYDQIALAAVVSLSLLGLVASALLFVRNPTIRSFLLAFVLCVFVMLHIQISRGVLEFHFGVFVSLAILLVYLDWRVIAFAASLFALHHIAFDRLQAMGLGFYCTAKADILTIILHATYVIIQTVIEVFIAIKLGRYANQGAELKALVSRVRNSSRLSLDVGDILVKSGDAKALQDLLLSMSAAVTALNESAHSLETASGEIASGNQDLGDRTEKSANHLQQISIKVNDLTSVTGLTAQNTDKAKSLAVEASAVAQNAGSAVERVVKTMQEIDVSARKIADITGIIDSIAFQTNLLSLNAAVEAARAGEQGRGFAVVASEVRSLARRTAQAAQEINELITNSSTRVTRGTNEVNEAGRTMRSVVAAIDQLSSVIRDISHASSSQTGGVTEVNFSVREIEQSTQQNATMVEQMAAAAANLNVLAKRMVIAVTAFDTGNSAVKDAENYSSFNH